jgi:hypothetical protein
VNWNPFVCLRQKFSGKTLDEILNFDKMRDELTEFYARMEKVVEAKAKQIEALTAQNAVHTDHMTKAKITSNNLHVIMTEVLGQKPAETVEPTNNNEAQ